MNSALSPTDIEQLCSLLERRLAIIRDSELRENDPDEQLRQLQEVSENIVEAHTRCWEQCPPRLRHFFEGCSYDKALSFLREMNP